MYNVYVYSHFYHSIVMLSSVHSYFPLSIRLVMKRESTYIMHTAKITQALFEDVIGCLISMYINV